VLLARFRVIHRGLAAQFLPTNVSSMLKQIQQASMQQFAVLAEGTDGMQVTSSGASEGGWTRLLEARVFAEDDDFQKQSSSVRHSISGGSLVSTETAPSPSELK
jgi:hypothetical protein